MKSKLIPNQIYFNRDARRRENLLLRLIVMYFHRSLNAPIIYFRLGKERVFTSDLIRLHKCRDILLCIRIKLEKLLCKTNRILLKLILLPILNIHTDNFINCTHSESNIFAHWYYFSNCCLLSMFRKYEISKYNSFFIQFNFSLFVYHRFCISSQFRSAFL